MITLVDGDAEAQIAPERGGLVTRFRAGGRELLFLDRATFDDPTKNVRGGIPVLFPFAGKPPPGVAMKQHGFARTLPWAVESQAPRQLVCALEANDATRAVFPHDFRLALTVSLAGTRLALTFTVTNRGAAPMPLHFGLHPYFFVPLDEKAGATVTTSATRAFDNRTGQTGPLPRFSFGGEEVDLHLLDHAEPRTTLRGRVALAWSPGFTTLVLWTLPGQPFVCVEPWSAPAGTLGQRSLAPAATAVFEFSVQPG